MGRDSRMGVWALGCYMWGGQANWDSVSLFSEGLDFVISEATVGFRNRGLDLGGFEKEHLLYLEGRACLRGWSLRFAGERRLPGNLTLVILPSPSSTPYVIPTCCHYAGFGTGLLLMPHATLSSPTSQIDG